MIREKIVYPTVKKIKPFFWKTCRFCDREFKREGYEIEDYTQVNRHLYLSYSCDECGKSKENIKALISKTKIDHDLLRKIAPPKKGWNESHRTKI